MGFLKTAFFALLAMTAGFAGARPVSDVPAPSPAPVIGGDCGSRGPNAMVPCCANKILHGIPDASCVTPASSPSPAPVPPTPSPSPIPVVGSTCASTGPNNLAGCCADKAKKGETDPTCPKPSPSPMPGADCASVGPNNFAGCCAEKAKKGETDPTCPKPSPSPSPTPAPIPIVGRTCAVTSPGHRSDCCAQKQRDNIADNYCTAMGASCEHVPSAPGTTSGTSAIGSDGQTSFTPVPIMTSAECCAEKKRENIADAWCTPPAPTPAPIVGASCAVTSPGHRSDCCAQKQRDHVADDYCTVMGASCEHVPSAPGTTSGTSAIGSDGQTSFTPVPIMTSAECCAEKKRENIADAWCTPPAPTPTPTAPAVPMCPCPTAPGPDVSRTNVPATSEFGQFTFPDGAWSDVLNVTADFPIEKFVGCDGAFATRNNSESLEDCQRYTTSLRFATAMIWDPATKTCNPIASSAATYNPAPVDDSKVYPQLSHWTLDSIPVNVTIPGACARNATVLVA